MHVDTLYAFSALAPATATTTTKPIQSLDATDFSPFSLAILMIGNMYCYWIFCAFAALLYTIFCHLIFVLSLCWNVSLNARWIRRKTHQQWRKNKPKYHKIQTAQNIKPMKNNNEIEEAKHYSKWTERWSRTSPATQRNNNNNSSNSVA